MTKSPAFKPPPGWATRILLSDAAHGDAKMLLWGEAVAIVRKGERLTYDKAEAWLLDQEKLGTIRVKRERRTGKRGAIFLVPMQDVYEKLRRDRSAKEAMQEAIHNTRRRS